MFLQESKNVEEKKHANANIEHLEEILVFREKGAVNRKGKMRKMGKEVSVEVPLEKNLTFITFKKTKMQP